MATKKRRTAVKSKTAIQKKPRCGLCNKTGKLTRTACCGNWICDDYEKYVMFSYSNVSCQRNHERYTLCCYHFTEEHKEPYWHTCKACRGELKTEMYVWYGTNEFNFTKLENPPEFEPTLCAACKRVIRLGADGYMTRGDGYLCEGCFPAMNFGAG